MNRFKIFLKSIWEDVGMNPSQFIAAIGAGIVIGCIVMIPIIGLAYFLSWITEIPMEEGALNASIGLWMIFLVIVLFVGYLKKKWREST